MDKFSYMSRNNLEYIEQQFENFKSNPDSIDPNWRLFFEGVEFAKNLGGSVSAGSTFSNKEIDVYDLIRYYRDYGHLKALLDPLSLTKPESSAFDLKNFNLSDADLGTTFSVGSIIGKPNSALKDIISHLERIYCGTITAQLAECAPEIRDWFHGEFENNSPDLKIDNEKKKQIYQSLARTESLEKFIHTRYVGTKRFSIEGGDAMMPMLEHMVERGITLGVEEIVIGMAHRGRVNVLANFMEKGIDVIFAEFDGITIDQSLYDGDVKYHMGYECVKKTAAGSCNVSLAFNPSHLECVNPVVMGMARAKQRQRNDTELRKKVVPLQIHGDAAFAGQGVVSESLQMSQLKGYRVGGSVHIIVNNQVGFTTDPYDARSTRYSSDMAKSIKAPVILVNGDDAEACVRAMDMAIRFRQKFGQDIVIDLICYRRFGHNEGDEPAFTQPKMYGVIKGKQTLMQMYADKLQRENILPKETADAFYKEKIDNLQKVLDGVRKSPPEIKLKEFAGLWKGLRRGTEKDFEKSAVTKASADHLKKVATLLTSEPAGVALHPKIQKLIGDRKKMVDDDKLDWAMGELLAYGTLRMEGIPVRLSGQDCMRGTFTHRQAAYFDINTGLPHIPLATINPSQGEFVVYNSLLSEMAVLGFEYGNASSDPTFLFLWEAQFGDFANGAQIIIDQFLSSGEAKWDKHNGLVLLLPHGYEGQGPEHSSARLERFLQLCAQANMQVCNLTTPANLFHALRRQVKREFRKPLVIMSPKSLLRHPSVISSMKDLSNGQFEEVIADPRTEDPKKVQTLVLTSGKLYYDIDKARGDKLKGGEKLAVVRVEQLYPFPATQLAPFLNGFPSLRRIVWAQEEPKNMGGYFSVAPRLRKLLDDLGLKKIEVEYMGRDERASPAVGSPKRHEKEQTAIVQNVLSTANE